MQCLPKQNFYIISVFTALDIYDFDRSLHTVAPIIRLLASTMSAQKGNGNPLESNLKKGWVHIPYDPTNLFSDSSL